MLEWLLAPILRPLFWKVSFQTMPKVLVVRKTREARRHGLFKVKLVGLCIGPFALCILTLRKK